MLTMSAPSMCQALSPSHDLCVTPISCLQSTVPWQAACASTDLTACASLNTPTLNCCDSTQEHRITLDISFTCEAKQWIVFIDYFHPSDGKYFLCCLHMYKVIFCIKNWFSTENTFVHIYKHTFILVTCILPSTVCKKKSSLYVSLFIFTLKWNGKSCICKEFLLAKHIIYFGSINQRAVMLQNMGSPFRNIPSGGMEVQYIIPAVSNK